MLARLWWKDARQFWPVWVFLTLAAAGCQWFALRYGGPDARHGWLVPLAAGWAAFYGFAVSSAAFSGERENNTLQFLDTLPVSRPVLWGGKSSFAAVTTLVLAAGLFAMAWLGTDDLRLEGWRRPGYEGETHYSAAWVVLGLGAGLLEVLGWGLLWSALSSNALVAAVLAIGSALLSMPAFRGALVVDSDTLVESIPLRVALFLGASAASAAVLVLGGRPRRSARERLGAGAPIGGTRNAGRGDRRSPSRRVLSPEVRAIVWQTVREAWPVWWRLAAIGIGLPFVGLLLGFEVDPGLFLLLTVLLTVVAGVSIFGLENRGRTNRFLAHHSARPGVVWVVKVAVWAACLAVPVVLTMAPWLASERFRGRGGEGLFYVSLAMVTAFAVGQLCGMTIHRGITAGLVAVVSLFAVGVPQIVLGSWGMLPALTTLLVPLVFLVVSRAWAADWLLERPGAGRWARLALWLSGGFLLVLAVHAGSRVWGVPDYGPPFDVPAFVKAATVAEKDNAAGLYREAARLLKAGDAKASQGRSSSPAAAPTGDDPAAVDEGNDKGPLPESWGPPMDLVRRASLLPACRFVRLDRPEPANELSYQDMHYVTSPFVESATRATRRGDLAGAWDDLMVILRVARQMSGPVPFSQVQVGLFIEHEALGRAMEWAADPRQTPERVRAALVAYQSLLPRPAIIDTYRAEAVLAENTLNLPASVLDVLAYQHVRGPNKFEEVGAALHAAAMTAPWELARARRAIWLLFEALGQRAAKEPRDRLSPGPFGWSEGVVTIGHSVRLFVAGELDSIERTTPQVRLFVGSAHSLPIESDRNEVTRRALVQILALRHYQLTHGGKLPERLDELVTSGELPGLPLDPYANRPFGYVRSTGQSLNPLGRLYPDPHGLGRRRFEGSWLLYSIGSDLSDDQARGNDGPPRWEGDIIFPLPPG